MKPAQLKPAIRQRLSHNEAYLAQSIETREAASALTYGKAKSREWLEAQAECIGEENEFLRVLLEDRAMQPLEPAPAPVFLDASGQ